MEAKISHMTILVRLHLMDAGHRSVDIRENGDGWLQDGDVKHQM